MADFERTAPSNANKHLALLHRIVHRLRFRRGEPTGPDPVPEGVEVIKASQLFDAKWYLAKYPDVAKAGMDPVEHYLRHGAAEGRDPCSGFSTAFYLEEYPDVALSGMNPFRHFVERGAEEFRLAAPLGSGRILGGPLISIIVPVYAVEQYLPQCLDSIVRQTYRNLEIIVVDDGSPDESFAIASAYAQSDRRIKVVRRENGGLGAARNTGVAEATGSYLTFADSDDTLPPDAIARMFKSLRQTGSDFAVGAMRRLRHGKLAPPDGWVKEVHAEDRTALRLVDFPQILTDVFACNKLFDAEFFRSQVGRFPERIRYEDQEPTARAYLNGTFDVLAATVYHWRVREDGSSITQRKSDPEDLHDRLIVKQRVSRILADADASVYGTWLAKAIGFDLRPYFEQVPRTGVEYFDQLRQGMLQLAGEMTTELWRKVRIVDRLPALAVLAGLREDVGTAITRREEYGYFVPSRIAAGRVYLDRNYLERMELSPPDELLELGDADLHIVARATSLRWHSGRLCIKGYAYVTSLQFNEDTAVTARLVCDGLSPVKLETEQCTDPRIDRETQDAWNSQARSGFSIEIDPTQLALDSGAPWRMEITVCDSESGVRKSTMLRDVDVRGITGTPPVSALAGDTRWIAAFETGLGFVLRHVNATGPRVDAVHTNGEDVTISMEPCRADTLVAICRTLRRQIRVIGHSDDTGKLVFNFRLPSPPGNNNSEHLWDILLAAPEGNQHLTFPGDRDALELMSPEHHRVRAFMTGEGTLRLAQNRWWAVADEVQASERAITIHGRIDAPDAVLVTARLAGDTQQFESDQVDLDPVTQTFRLRIPFDEEPGDAQPDERAGGNEITANAPGASRCIGAAAEAPREPRPTPRPTMLHGFSARLSVTQGSARSESWLRVSTSLQRRFPADRTASRYGLSFTRTPKASALWVRFRPPYQDDERGRLAQHRLHQTIFHGQVADNERTMDLEDAIVFESFGGRQVSDSVLAICNEISRRRTGLKLYWTVADLGISVPSGTTPLLIHSREWMLVLSRARYLVNNNNFPFYFRKRPGQIYLQVWHGTPLKRIGNDVPQANLSLSYRRLMSRECQYWDYLLAQNDFASRSLPQAFGYSGHVLNVGYPRNDALVDSSASRRRLRVRGRFGFEPYHFVVLYAPTWRDNIRGRHGYERVNYLDFKRIHRIVGGNTRIMLRGHHNTSRNAPARIPGVIDVTHHPDINDLLLASDMLITDYSSVMFDYVVTGKPIMFLTPDLEQYRDQTRGFYLDFEKIAPGPICRDNEDLAETLSHLGQVIETCSAHYAAFRHRFAPRDDGFASARVVDSVWGPDQFDDAAHPDRRNMLHYN